MSAPGLTRGERARKQDTHSKAPRKVPAGTPQQDTITCLRKSQKPPVQNTRIPVFPRSPALEPGYNTPRTEIDPSKYNFKASIPPKPPTQALRPGVSTQQPSPHSEPNTSHTGLDLSRHLVSESIPDNHLNYAPRPGPIIQQCHSTAPISTSHQLQHIVPHTPMHQDLPPCLAVPRGPQAGVRTPQSRSVTPDPSSILSIHHPSTWPVNTPRSGPHGSEHKRVASEYQAYRPHNNSEGQ